MSAHPLYTPSFFYDCELQKIKRRVFEERNAKQQYKIILFNSKDFKSAGALITQNAVPFVCSLCCLSGCSSALCLFICWFPPMFDGLCVQFLFSFAFFFLAFLYVFQSGFFHRFWIHSILNRKLIRWRVFLDDFGSGDRLGVYVMGQSGGRIWQLLVLRHRQIALLVPSAAAHRS